jgi:biopolymer transport protein TolR
MAFSSNKDEKPVSEINVTPLVDVMLVLLVIFMVTAPMMLNGINLNLPKTQKSEPVTIDEEIVILSINSLGKYFIGKDLVKKEELVASLKKVLIRSKKKTVFLRADKDLKYGIVARSMSLLKAGGINQISLITEIEN